MTVRPEAASPVTAPRTLTLAGVFGGVQSAARNRLDHTIPGLADHSRLPNTIAQGPATLPRALASNPLVAEVRSFQPGPGAQAARQNVLNVRNDPGHQDDGVIKALQRYFNVQPRRGPSADPRDEASVVRHPQGLVQSSARWDQDMFYQFTDNGAANYQIRPDYRAWGGRLDLELTGAGQATVSSPSTRAPQPGATAVDKFGYYDPANAAQEALRRMQADLAPGNFSPTLVGPPNMVDNPRFDPPFAAQNAFRRMRADLAPGSFSPTLVGPPNMADNPRFDPPFAAQNALRRIQADLAPGNFSPTLVGPPNMADNPRFDPSFAAQNAFRRMRADLPDGSRPLRAQADMDRAQEIRDNFFRTGPSLSDWS